MIIWLYFNYFIQIIWVVVDLEIDVSQLQLSGNKLFSGPKWNSREGPVEETD